MALRIKEILKERNIKVADLAEMVGITQGAMSIAINGNPTVSTLEKIAEALDLQVPDLFDSHDVQLNCPHCGKPLSIRVE